MRRLEVIRGAWGTCLIVGADVASVHIVKAGRDSAAPVVIRVLGSRQLAQALATVGTHNAMVHRIGAAVDMLHAASMLVVATMDNRKRRAAIIDACIATTFAVAELRRARR